MSLTPTERAEQHLRLIRTLMERATIYRTISAPTALFGGLLALIISATIWIRERHWAARSPESMRHISTREFSAVWLAALGAVILFNTFLVWRQAQSEGREFFSPALRLALRAILPCLVLPAAVTIWFFSDGYASDNELLLVGVWIGFYGLALVATQHFAPRSLVLLGWAFLLTATAMVLVLRQLEYYSAPLVPNLAMGVTFGLYHLVYAGSTWSARSSAHD